MRTCCLAYSSATDLVNPMTACLLASLPPRVLCYRLRTTAAPRPHENTRRLAHRLRTGSLRVSNFTKKPEQRMCQPMPMSEKSKNVRNSRVSDVAAWPRTDCDEECVTTYRHVPKCRLCLSDSTPGAPSRLFPREEVVPGQNESSNRRRKVTTFLILGSVFRLITSWRSGCTPRCAPNRATYVTSTGRVRVVRKLGRCAGTEW
jgi:hypothetical protein